MLIPLRDINPRQRFPVVTLLLVLANLAAFLFQLQLDDVRLELLVRSAGAIPYEITRLVDIYPRGVVRPPFTIFTSMFLHGGWMHLIGNMWFLWIFGDNVEDRMRPGRFLVFYLLTGAVGALAQSFTMPGSRTPMIGASGAVAGILGGYSLIFAHSRVVTLIPIPFFWHVTAVRAWVFLGLWFVGQFFIGAGSGVAWMAHVGGFLAGMGLVRLFLPRRELTTLELGAPPPRLR